MNDGLRQFRPRNAHDDPQLCYPDTGQMPQQLALERLATLRLFARWVDECDLIEAPA